MAVKSRTAVPMALLMLVLALALCQGAPTRMLLQGGNGDGNINIVGNTNTQGGNCDVQVTISTGEIEKVTFNGGVGTLSSVCHYTNTLTGNQYVTIYLPPSACGVVGGQCCVKCDAIGKKKPCSLRA